MGVSIFLYHNPTYHRIPRIFKTVQIFRTIIIFIRNLIFRAIRQRNKIILVVNTLFNKIFFRQKLFKVNRIQHQITHYLLRLLFIFFLYH